MRKGPNRRIISSGVFLLHEGTVRSLGKFRQVDFSQRSEAERDVIRVHDWYRSFVHSEQWAPDHATVAKRTTKLIAAITALKAEIKAFEGEGQKSQARLEFNEAIRDLLRDKGFDFFDMNVLFDEVRHPLDQLGTFLRIIGAELSRRLQNGEIAPSSTKEIREEYIRRLYQVLTRHALNDGTGINSLIVQVILRLDGREAAESELDEARRKEAASEVRKAVKPQKGG